MLTGDIAAGSGYDFKGSLVRPKPDSQETSQPAAVMTILPLSPVGPYSQETSQPAAVMTLKRLSQETSQLTGDIAAGSGYDISG